MTSDKRRSYVEIAINISAVFLIILAILAYIEISISFQMVSGLMEISFVSFQAGRSTNTDFLIYLITLFFSAIVVLAAQVQCAARDSRSIGNLVIQRAQFPFNLTIELIRIISVLSLAYSPNAANKLTSLVMSESYVALSDSVMQVLILIVIFFAIGAARLLMKSFSMIGQVKKRDGKALIYLTEGIYFTGAVTLVLYGKNITLMLVGM